MEFNNFLIQLGNEGHTDVLKGVWMLPTPNSPYGYSMWADEVFERYRE